MTINAIILFTYDRKRKHHGIRHANYFREKSSGKIYSISSSGKKKSYEIQETTDQEYLKKQNKKNEITSRCILSLLSEYRNVFDKDSNVLTTDEGFWQEIDRNALFSPNKAVATLRRNGIGAKEASRMSVDIILALSGTNRENFDPGVMEVLEGKITEHYTGIYAGLSR